MENFDLQATAIDSYLREYCEVNGISETDLSSSVGIFTSRDPLIVAVVDVSHLEEGKLNVKFGFTPNGESVFGSYVNEMDKYPKTTKLLTEYGGKIGQTS